MIIMNSNYAAQKKRALEARTKYNAVAYGPSDPTPLTESDQDSVYVSKLKASREKASAKISGVTKSVMRDKIFNEALIGALAAIVDKSILLDEDYQSKNIAYKQDVRDLISTVLEATELNVQTMAPELKTMCQDIMMAIPEKIKDIDITDEVATKIADEITTEVMSKNAQSVEDLADTIQTIVVDKLEDEKDHSAEICDNEMCVMRESDEQHSICKVEKNKTLFESFAYNDAKRQLALTKNYDAELAVANGMVFQTTLEALDVLRIFRPNQGQVKALSEALCSF